LAKYALKVILYLAAVSVSILGAHGLFVFLNRVELHGLTKMGYLFYSIPVPVFIQPVVEWASRYGRAGWEVFGLVIPHWVISIVVILAILLWVAARKVKTKGKASGKHSGKKRRKGSRR